MHLIKDKSTLIVNPDEDCHFMQYKKPTNKIKVYFKDILIAESSNTILVKEVGHEVYDGVYYFPALDIVKKYLNYNENKSFCPLKGKASYFDFKFSGVDTKDIAWSYEGTFHFSSILNDHIAFYSNKVKIIIEPK